MVVCTGSIAYDYILNFKGRFREHILPDKTHILNLSFLVDDLHKRRGGVAGNYAYNLSLLGYPAAVLATAGADAAEYRAWLEERGIDCRGLRLMDGEITATGFTTTDLDDNQITGYYGGAMLRAADLGLADAPSDTEAVVIGPNAAAASQGAWILIGNDYEIELVKERMACDDTELMKHSEMVVTTLGREGSR